MLLKVFEDHKRILKVSLAKGIQKARWNGMKPFTTSQSNL